MSDREPGRPKRSGTSEAFNPGYHTILQRRRPTSKPIGTGQGCRLRMASRRIRRRARRHEARRCRRASATTTSAPGSAIVLSKAARSAAVRAIGPSTANGGDCGSASRSCTTPGLGLIPRTPFQPGGFRNDPMKSLPSATGMKPDATATAAPPLLPPALRVGSATFTVVGAIWL